MIFSYRNKKLYWKEPEDLIKQINELCATDIISIKLAVPDMTTTLQCSAVYYEYIVDN